jgi:GTP cyclohydrolase II
MTLHVPSRDDAPPINGDPVAVDLDRVLSELRRGRAVLVRGGAGPIVVPVETASQGLYARLRRHSPSGMQLVLTAERAHALGVVAGQRAPIVLALPATATLDEARQLAGIEPASPSRILRDAMPARDPALQVALRLVKHARLVPAVLAVANTRNASSGLLAIDADRALALLDAAEVRLERVSAARVPLEGLEECELVLFRDPRDGAEHLAVRIGHPMPGSAVPVRLHSACLTGDLLGSLRCDCGSQLRRAVERIGAAGGGVLLYLAQEGRGIGLANKLRAYAMQDEGLDTVDADERLGFRADERSYAIAAAILRALGISRIQLFTNNPEKLAALAAAGLEIDSRRPLPGESTPHNLRYLRAKRERAGHWSGESDA